MPCKSKHLMPEGLRYVFNAIQRHSLVENAEIAEQDFYHAIIHINRIETYPSLIAYIADVYILTASDVSEILDKYQEVNCIVVISNWNHYTEMAKYEARMNKVGVFTLSEFLEAMKFHGKRFLETGAASKIE